MIFDGMVKHFQSPQNIKFAMSLQYLQKEVRKGVHFLHLDKHPDMSKVSRIRIW